MADLDLSTIANVATAAAVIVALALGLLQWSAAERKRRDLAAVELVRSFQSEAFTRAARIVAELSEGLTDAELSARGPETEDALLYVHMAFENLGLLVYRRVIPLDLAAELMGGFAVASWKRQRSRIEGFRRRLGSEKMGEWYQWLVERIEARSAAMPQVGAHVKYRDWKE
ncbi:MAG: hypothetical protein HY556_05740 [Euryarchaeota archaeon]|nr:hypothetical protein [Euryarchaeota archaeon]